ncbi:MAG: tetratricopeptide repeat protein [bacterium]|nr:tetratricopeptide repeat protein [bacterium]
MNTNQEANKLAKTGRDLLKQSKFEDALKILEQAIELDPKNIKIWENKASALCRLYRFKELLSTYEKIIELNPKDAWTWTHKGTTILLLGKPAEALKSFEQALQLNPKNVLAWNNKGLSFLMLNRLDEALLSFEKAFKLDSKGGLKKEIAGTCHFIFEEKSEDTQQDFLKLISESTLNKELLFQILKFHKPGKEPKKTSDNASVAHIEMSMEYKANYPEEIFSAFAQQIQEFLKNKKLECKPVFKFQNSLPTPNPLPSLESASGGFLSDTKCHPASLAVAAQLENLKLKFPTPPDTKWDDVTIQFISDAEIKITVKKTHKNFNFAEIGFKDARKGDVPDSQWKVLQYLARQKGEISWKSETESLKDFPKFPKRIETIRKRLKAIMGINSDPFYDYKKVKSYKSKFKIIQ